MEQKTGVSLSAAQVTDRVKPTWQASGSLETGVFAGPAEVALAWTLFDTEIQEAPAVSHPRVRFTVRRLMLVVLVVAALLTAFEAGRRWERAKTKTWKATSHSRIFPGVETEFPWSSHSNGDS